MKTRTGLFINGLLILAFVCLISPSSPSRVRGAPQNELTIGTLESVANLDPADSRDFFTWEVLTHLYTGLTRQKPNSIDYELALAVTHTVSESGLTHTFTIRPDAAFSDGTLITAQTFADSINRVITLRGKGADAITPYVESVSVDASGALVFKLKAPIPYLLQLLALPPYFPVHPKIFSPNALNPLSKPLITNGIYRLRDANKTQIVLEADSAWRGDKPATPQITIRTYPAVADLRDAFKQGEVQIIWHGLPLQDIETVAKLPGVQVVSTPGLQAFYVLINQQAAPFNDITARRGLALLLDRERAVKLSLGATAQPLYNLLPPALNNRRAPDYPAFSSEAATKALSDGGYSSFKPLSAEMNISIDLYGALYGTAAEVLTGQFIRQDTLRVVRFDTEAKTFLDQLDRGAFRLMLIGFVPIVPHPAAYLDPLLNGQLAGSAQYHNALIAEWLAQAANSTTAGENALYANAQTQAASDLVALPLWVTMQNVVIGPTVKGVLIEPNALLHYERLTFGQ